MAFLVGRAAVEDPVAGHASMWTSFCGDLSIELWHKNAGSVAVTQEALFVRVLYCGVPVLHAAASDSDGLCSLEAWQSLLEPYTASTVPPPPSLLHPSMQPARQQQGLLGWVTAAVRSALGFSSTETATRRAKM